MKIGVRKSPHLEFVCQGLEACGETLTSEYDGGADFFLAWGWPQAEQVAHDLGGRDADIICVDAHPFALAAGAKTGARIFQLSNWGALARYPEPEEFPLYRAPRKRSVSGGPLLVLGHVSSTEQQRQGLIDVWHTKGGDAWLVGELEKPGRKFRPHPRMWNAAAANSATDRQPTLAEDLKGCSGAVAWNSTAVVHARLLGYPANTVEPHGWGALDLGFLDWLQVMPSDLRSGLYWRNVYRPWLEKRHHASTDR